MVPDKPDYSGFIFNAVVVSAVVSPAAATTPPPAAPVSKPVITEEKAVKAPVAVKTKRNAKTCSSKGAS
jgi:hypothetical protein